MAEVHPVMNDTKWNELRLAMHAIERTTNWRCMSTTGYYSAPDAEWFYHFSAGGYEDIRYVDIFADSPSHRDEIRSALKTIHVPGEETDGGFRVYGYSPPGQSLNYL
jgi:hypothetical protein